MIRTTLLVTAVLWALAATASAECTCATPGCTGHTSWQSGSWRLVQTANFRVCVLATEAEALSLAISCEQLRGHLCDKWLGPFGVDAAVQTWSPKCYVVVHPTAESYLREVGPGQQTAGSSLIELGTQSVAARRIDLRADHPEGYRDALAHEMTHVVVAERFVERQIPRWADEGMAVLADSQAKQLAHLVDLHDAHHRGRTFRLAELFALQEYPTPDQQAVFYGQSISLAKYLVERGSAEQFVRFVELATHSGYDTAARSVYGFESVGDLERQWRVHLASPRARMASDDKPPSRNTPLIGRQVSLVRQ
ncbi:MAG TPA: hypothetical protein VHZ24_11970 [Pirellulales bacterium]|jgi:hypothetical protein|nr:hypothetical protein [Pirellulales bacterium]